MLPSVAVSEKSGVQLTGMSDYFQLLTIAIYLSWDLLIQTQFSQLAYRGSSTAKTASWIAVTITSFVISLRITMYLAVIVAKAPEILDDFQSASYFVTYPADLSLLRLQQINGIAIVQLFNGHLRTSAVRIGHPNFQLTTMFFLYWSVASLSGQPLRLFCRSFFQLLLLLTLFCGLPIAWSWRSWIRQRDSRFCSCIPPGLKRLGSPTSCFLLFETFSETFFQMFSLDFFQLVLMNMITQMASSRLIRPFLTSIDTLFCLAMALFIFSIICLHSRSLT